MKATHIDNCTVSKVIEEALGIQFKNEEFRLSSWGDSDNHCRISDTTYVLLECERGQKHPNTNVLKLYPYLEEQPDIKIVLLHYFFPENKAPKNRLSLCYFIAKKMEQQFPERFQYLKLPQDIKVIPSFLRQEKKGLIQKLLTGEVRVKIDKSFYEN
jgi:hypothetical protein